MNTQKVTSFAALLLCIVSVRAEQDVSESSQVACPPSQVSALQEPLVPLAPLEPLCDDTAVLSESEYNSLAEQPLVSHSRRVIVDEIIATVYTAQGVFPIARSDVARPLLTGERQSLRDYIIRTLLYCKALEYQIPPDERAIDQMLERMQDVSGLSRAALMNLFCKELGYPDEQAVRSQLIRDQLSSEALGALQRDPRMVVTEADIKQFNDANPVVIPASYDISVAYVPYTLQTRDELEASLQKGYFAPTISWDDPLTIEERDLRPEMRAVTTVEDGAVFRVDYGPQGATVYKRTSSVSEHQVPYKQLRDGIKMRLMNERFARVYDEYVADLLKNAHVVFTYEADRKAVLGDES